MSDDTNDRVQDFIDSENERRGRGDDEDPPPGSHRDFVRRLRDGLLDDDPDSGGTEGR